MGEAKKLMGLAKLFAAKGLAERHHLLTALSCQADSKFSPPSSLGSDSTKKNKHVVKLLQFIVNDNI
jgi:hypothetical protein